MQLHHFASTDGAPSAPSPTTFESASATVIRKPPLRRSNPPFPQAQARRCRYADSLRRRATWRCLLPPSSHSHSTFRSTGRAPSIWCTFAPYSSLFQDDLTVSAFPQWRSCQKCLGESSGITTIHIGQLAHSPGGCLQYRLRCVPTSRGTPLCRVLSS